MDKTAFEQQYKDVAQRTAAKLGVPAEGLLAQWGLETGYGKSIIPGTNNLGNIKDFSGKGVSATDNLTGSKDKYRAYASVDAFADDFAGLIKRRYPNAMNQPTVEGFATALKAGGYAEDKDYVSKIVSIAGGKVANTAPVVPQPQRTWPGLTEDTNLPARLAAATGVYRQQEEAEPSALEMLGAAIGGNTDVRLMRPIRDALFGEEFEPVAGFNADLKQLAGRSWDSTLLEDYTAATSPQAAQKVLDEFDEEAFRTQTMGAQGTATAIGLGFAGEALSVTNWATAFAAPVLLAARGVGSAALSAQGASRTAVIGSSIAENAIGGTAIEATLQLMEGRFNGTDLAISAVADSLIGAGAGALTSRAASMARGQQMVQNIGDSATVQEAEAVAKAQAKLGPDATTEQVVAEVQAARVADVNEPVRNATQADPSLEVTRTPGLGQEFTNGQAAADELANYPTVSMPSTVGEYTPPVPTTPGFISFVEGNTNELTKTNGAPRVVYHLSNADVDAFDKTKLGSNTGAASSREGFFFAGKVQTTHAYARPDEGAPNVMPVYLSIKNPLVFDMAGKEERVRSYASLLREAKAKGNDGLIVKNTYDGGPQDDIIVVFEPTQVKSAISNTGEYSQVDPRVNYDAEGAFDSLEKLVQRRTDFANGGKYEAEILERTGGMIKNLKGLEALPAGVHVTPNLAKEHMAAFDTISKLARRFLKDTTIVLHSGDVLMPDGKRANADISQVTDKIALVRLDPSLTGAQAVRSAVHEIGHAIFNRHIASLSPAHKARLMVAFEAFKEAAKRGNGNEARAMRYSLTNPSLLPDVKETTALSTDYELDWDEFSAEQFAKFMDEDIAGANRFGLNAKVVQMVKAAINNALAWLKFAKREGLGVTDEYREFFETLSSDPVVTQARKTLSLRAAQADKPATVVQSIMTDPDANRFGLGTIPVATKTERDEAKAILNLHKNAEQKAPAMTPDYEKKVKNLSDNSVFNVASTGLIMLKSQSPLVRWIAGELLEDASGVQVKRGTTAAIKKHVMERQMMGNVINEYDSAYTYWKKGKPGGWQDDLIGGKNRAEFDRTVAAEIEARRLARGPVSTDQSVKGAADVLEAAYTRTAKAQVSAKTLGSEGLPPDSIGYMPHRMSAKAVLNLTNEQRGVVHQALVDQFITIEGWDASFSDMLASRYLQRVTDRATGGNASSMSGNSAGAVDLVEEALNAMALPADEVKKHMDKFKKGGANYTKGRIELDLNKAYPTASGEFKLLDIFETNQIELIRSQVQRASGDVALTLKGVQGKPGLQLLRKAMQFGEDGKKATTRELEAFDQIAAEFLGEPFGTATPRWMERAMSANTLVRLGGIVFNQISESINGIVHVGAMRAMESVTGIPRLRQEILALARGEKVDNSIIGSIEIAGGAEFGTDAYKIVMPYDNPTNVMPTYGQDTLTLTDRLLRGGGHIQAKLSGWRAIHSAQQRGMAEQIVHKTLRYIREGKDDVALQQFGITPELRAAMRSELGQIAEFDASGRLTKFDVTKMTDPAMREQLIQAVWRGTSQIIQGTYIGERGKWAHDGTMKLLTQFRTFSITSMEKQWGRQRNSRGAFATFGIIMGAMSLAAPIYMARTYLSSVGRPDQEAYLEERFQPQHIARATMNYVANVGMAGDFIDGLSSMMPEDLGIKATGGRSGVESEFVGNYVAPASSLVNDIWSYAQSPLELQDAAKILPMSRLPYLLPLMNQTRD